MERTPVPAEPLNPPCAFAFPSIILLSFFLKNARLTNAYEYIAKEVHVFAARLVGAVERTIITRLA